jgi:hypothetical protein
VSALGQWHHPMAGQGQTSCGWRRGDIVGLASAEEGLRARVLGLGWSGGQRILGGNVTGTDRGFSPVVMQMCTGERDRARVLGWACMREIKDKREMRLV